MSKTIENLLAAFAGESQARNKYTYYAKIARKEGYNYIAKIFEETADNECQHAKDEFKLAGKMGNTTENLKAAIEGEHYEVTEMYPEFAKTAREEGNKEAAILFESGGAKQLDKVVLVTASIEIRIERVMKRDHISEEDVLARMSKQWSDEKKKKNSDFIIVNDEVKPLLEQIEYVLHSL